MLKTYIDLEGDKSRGIKALAGQRAAYSDAVRVDLSDHTLLFVSGKLGVDGKGVIASRSMREQTRQVLENIRSTIAKAGGSMTDIVRVRIYVAAIDDASIRDVHEVRREFFNDGELPASTMVRVDQFVRDGALIEIEADVVMAR
ncbi:RidA family protein [Mesorhizobium sp. VK23B]|uniref:RidA family protein n=2 Tax=Mesorhizobium TaxID=68287 RepID=A0ABU4WSI0_9HYPH|nr:MULTISPECIES: RidA family protein [unclassified Mesorhizobium]MDX8439006.1 RidA family protein [Mesorhizobium sp. VK3E]MDX8469854.1 RidA family protein [Mesorhizobium sp. VK23B]MDX8476193.1 RidA family protein [Mesorhizobium sp. VK23A]MDX8501773.1 RidA family protein [Mesorhizobium sp. VK4C]